ncbi:MAG TPA: maleylacetoacetate isomerase [Xanthobacteraceae bacterium]|nr:maleylacetoacetate isomerase [Xanthobacteraceae bacterium]
MKFFSFWRSLASFRVRIALNIKAIEAEVVQVNILKGEQCTDAFRRVNPQMLIPALDDGKGPILFQSLAILEYLEETHPKPALLPKDARARAWVRGMAGIVACDAHPLIVPRIRNFLEQEFKLDEPARLQWIRHWFTEGYKALETHLANDGVTGRFCCGDAITLADICLVSHSVGGEFFDRGPAPYPNVARITEACLKEETFAKAHPLKQPGAPAKIGH